jgi:predicted membrane metal-binding protein
VLGVTEGIDTDLQSAYAASGAMHVLAVSGLHVGIIYAIILVLLQASQKICVEPVGYCRYQYFISMDFCFCNGFIAFCITSRNYVFFYCHRTTLGMAHQYL